MNLGERKTKVNTRFRVKKSSRKIEISREGQIRDVQSALDLWRHVKRPFLEGGKSRILPKVLTLNGNPARAVNR